MPHKTILVPLAHGMQARNFLMTDVFSRLLAAGTRIILAVPQYKVNYYRELIASDQVIIEELAEKPESWLVARMKNIGINLLHTPTVSWWRATRWADKKKNIHYFLEIITSWLGFFYPIRAALRWLFGLAVDSSQFNRYFSQYKIDAVGLLDIYSLPDVFLFYAAKRHRVPAICFVRSWDNVTSKGTCLIKPEWLITHNEFVKQEAAQYIGVKPERIFVSGLPHFDYYYHYQPSVTREEYLKKAGLPENSRFLLFANASGSFAPIINELLKILDDAIADQTLPPDLRVLFRFAPNHTIGDRFYKTERIVFDQPGRHFKEDKKDDWEFNRADMIYMADSVYYSAVVLNFASTMTIDAAALDRPVVNIAFDGYTDKDTPHSLRRIYRVAHFKSVLASGGTPKVESARELIETVKNYLQNPSLDRPGRAKMVAEQCYKLDGKSGERTADFILEKLSEFNHH